MNLTSNQNNNEAFSQKCFLKSRLVKLRRFEHPHKETRSRYSPKSLPKPTPLDILNLKSRAISPKCCFQPKPRRVTPENQYTPQLKVYNHKKNSSSKHSIDSTDYDLIGPNKFTLNLVELSRKKANLKSFQEIPKPINLQNKASFKTKVKSTKQVKKNFKNTKLPKIQKKTPEKKSLVQLIQEEGFSAW